MRDRAFCHQRRSLRVGLSAVSAPCMRLLVLGGTAWLGRATAAAAVEAGHYVMCLARGASGATATGATLVVGDRIRPEAYDAVAEQRWDAVVDVARQPGQVRTAVAALESVAAHYVLVSSGNVYAEQRTVGADEDAPLHAPLAGDVMPNMEMYGPAKVACEQHVLRAFGPDRTMVARSGLLGGPEEPFDRSGYWPWRFARPAAPDGAVLVPDAPDQPAQLLDVRDLARWLVRAAEQHLPGLYNAVGETLPLGDHLERARRVAGHDGPVVAASPEWLFAHDVQEWMGERSLPLWLADPDWRGMRGRDGSRAVAAWLVRRPLEQTLADTLAWELSRPGHVRGAGLTDDDERALLAELRG